MKYRAVVGEYRLGIRDSAISCSRRKRLTLIDYLSVEVDTDVAFKLHIATSWKFQNTLHLDVLHAYDLEVQQRAALVSAAVCWCGFSGCAKAVYRSLTTRLKIRCAFQ